MKRRKELRMVFILSVTEYFKDISTSAKEMLKLFAHYD